MLEPGDSFGDYTVVRLLGKGGMGAVFLLEAADGGQIAAKILDPEASGDEESRKRFLREAQLALGVKHPNLVETYDVGEDPDTGLCYILMEYVPGGSLSDRIKKGPVPINEAISIVYQIASVLELARQKGIVHRDIKPDNIMFGADGKAKLADLGIARQGGATVTTVTQTGMMIGTPAYMAPEQMLDSHNVDTRADIYSLGIVFYEMLVGKRPNADDTVVQLMAKAVAGEPIPDVRELRPEVSASLAELIGLMCAMKADERVQTPADVTLALSQIVHGREVTIRRKRPQAVVAKAANRPHGDWSRKLLAVFLVLLLAAGGVFAYVSMQRHRASASASPTVRRDVAVPAETRLPDVRTRVETVVREQTNVIERTVVVTNAVGQEASAEPARLQPATGVSRQPDRTLQGRDWRPAGELRSASCDGRTWFYRLTDRGDVMLSRQVRDEDPNGRMLPPEGCVFPIPSGELVIPRELDGRPVVDIGRFAFSGCRGITSVVIPEGVVVVRAWAFYECSALQDVRIPDSLRVLEGGAFSCCIRLESLDLNLVESMPWGTALPERIREIRVSDNNHVYAVDDGVLYANRRTELVRYPPDRESVALPPSVVRVCNGAFVNWRRTLLVLPDSVRHMEKPFNGCPNLMEIRFGRHFATLSNGAFQGCSGLRRIVFEGDAPERVRNPNHPKEGMFVPDDQKSGWRRNRADLTVYVHKSSKGWNRPGEKGLPKLWPADGDPACARPIRYIEDGMTEDANAGPSAMQVPALPSKIFKLPRRQTLELVGCPAGKFEMGHPSGHWPIDTVHEVSFTQPFWIGKHPVTREQWMAMSGKSEMDLSPVDKALGGMKAPMVKVSLLDAKEFCRNLTRRLKGSLPKGYVFRLPTDAEWEYALKCGLLATGRDVPDGDLEEVRRLSAVTTEDKLMRLKRAGVAVKKDDVFIGSFEVCTKRPNEWGIYDMKGNADELILDTLSLEMPGGKTRQIFAEVKDVGPYQAMEKDPLRLYDGTDAIGLVRTCNTIRRCILPSARFPSVGFRVVLGLDLEREKSSKKAGKKRK